MTLILPFVPALPPVRPAERPSKDVHIAAYIDATERVIEPVSTKSIKALEAIRQAAGARVSADVMIDRRTEHPLWKLVEGATMLGLTKYSPIGLGLMMSWMASDSGLGTAVAVGAATAYVIYRGMKAITSTDAGFSSETKQASHLITSGWSGIRLAEPRWDGRRTYQIEASQSQRLDSPITSATSVPPRRSPEDIAAFLAESMLAYPSATNVLLLSGHGGAYRLSGGMPFDDYQKLIASVASQTGKPIDLLLLASCKLGNLEALAGTTTDVRYALVSEENLYAVNMSGILQSTLKESGQTEMTPRQLGLSLIAHADKEHIQVDQPYFNGLGKKAPLVRTLALVDMSKVADVTTAVGKLGNLLADEVAEGRTRALRDVVTGTQSYPLRDEDDRKHPSLGDLQIFIRRLQTAYSGQPLQTLRSGWSVRRVLMGDHKKKPSTSSYPEAAASPRAAAIQQAASEVLSALSNAVIKTHNEDNYAEAGGLSVQLPHPDMPRSPMFQKCAAPDGWKRFVNILSPRL